MPVQDLEKQVQTLPLDDLARFIQWFEAYRRQVLGDFSESDWEPGLTEEQRVEMLRRVEFARAHPEALEPWEGTSGRIRQRLHALRAEKAAQSGS